MTGTDASVRPASGVIVVAGPDGAGKSTLAAAIVAEAPGSVLWLHHRPRLLPARGSSEHVVTDPYGRPPYPPALGALKVLYYWVDYLLGWALRVRPVLRAGGLVVIERGWLDLAADPRRYRLAGIEGLIRVLGRLLPRTGHTFRLSAPVEVLAARTSDDLTAEDLQGQLDAQARVMRGAGVVVLDAQQPVTVLRDQVLAGLRAETAPRRLAGVPSAANPRWLLPVAPALVAAGALRIHRPMTPAASVVWVGARVGARLGAARLLPPAHEVDDALVSRLNRWIPAGGGVAVARSNHAGRHHALVVDARGAPVVHLKVAADDAGRSALALEAENLRRLGPRLVPPVRAPQVVHAEEGLLVTEAVRWRLRARPQELAPAAAGSLGQLWRDSGDGSAHGDFAPWNLLPAGNGWVLVDWEMVLADAPPFFDLLHWVVMAQSHLNRPGPGALQAGVRGEGWVGACIRAYAQQAGISTAALSEGIVGYLARTSDRTTLDPRNAQRETAAREALRNLAP